MKTLIKNCRIVKVDKILDGHCLIIEDGLIKDIAREEDIDLADFERIVDGQGNFLGPGFIDIHNHGNSGYDFMDASSQALESIDSYHLSKGVTSYLATIITSSQEDRLKTIENILSYKEREKDTGLIGIHLEGPFLNADKKGAQPGQHIREPDLELMSQMLEACQGNLKMLTLAPELEGSLALIDYLKKQNIAIAMGHSNASYDESMEAIERGGTIATHLFNAMGSFNHREPGLLTAALLDDRVFCEIIYDRYHNHDKAVELALRLKGSDRLILISDAMMAAGLEDGDYQLGGQPVKVEDGRARLKSGTIAGSTLDLAEAVYNMVEYLQFPLEHAVKMSSLNPARAIGLDDQVGSIEKGKKADLIVFDSSIKVLQVYRQGRLVGQLSVK